MLRRLAPLFAVLLSFFLDTAIVPAFYHGRYLLPLTLVVVILTGIQRGRVQGLIYGMIAGLLLDVSAGSLGLKLFPYMLIGFLIGFFLDQQPAIDRSLPPRERRQLLLVRIIWIAVLLLLHEVMLLIYQYFNTAVMQWAYIRDLLIRVCATTALCLLAYPLFRAFYSGSFRGHSRNTREVKNY